MIEMKHTQKSMMWSGGGGGWWGVRGWGWWGGGGVYSTIPAGACDREKWETIIPEIIIVKYFDSNHKRWRRKKMNSRKIHRNKLKFRVEKSKQTEQRRTQTKN